MRLGHPRKRNRANHRGNQKTQGPTRPRCLDFILSMMGSHWSCGAETGWSHGGRGGGCVRNALVPGRPMGRLSVMQGPWRTGRPRGSLGLRRALRCCLSSMAPAPSTFSSRTNSGPLAFGGCLPHTDQGVHRLNAWPHMVASLQACLHLACSLPLPQSLPSTTPSLASFQQDR